LIAITRARHDPATKEYLARKEAEGKPKRARCAVSNATLLAAFTTSYASHADLDTRSKKPQTRHFS